MILYLGFDVDCLAEIAYHIDIMIFNVVAITRLVSITSLTYLFAMYCLVTFYSLSKLTKTLKLLEYFLKVSRAGHEIIIPFHSGCSASTVMLRNPSALA